jgi:hypothetical protein
MKVRIILRVQFWSGLTVIRVIRGPETGLPESDPQSSFIVDNVAARGNVQTECRLSYVEVSLSGHMSFQQPSKEACPKDGRAAIMRENRTSGKEIEMQVNQGCWRRRRKPRRGEGPRKS